MSDRETYEEYLERLACALGVSIDDAADTYRRAQDRDSEDELDELLRESDYA